MPRGERTKPEVRDAYLALRKAGYDRTPAAKKVQIAYNTAVALDRLYGNPHLTGPETHAEAAQREIGEPIPYDELGEVAKRCLNDFGFFQRVVLGRIPVNWQIDAAHQVVEAVDSEEESWFDINLAPGVGKTTLFSHDIPAWITARDRTITGILGHAIQTKAEQYLRRLKNTLERTEPVKSDPRLVRRGDAVDAEYTMAQLFGRFKPQKGIWTADQIIVEQIGMIAGVEKEATWQAFGRKGGVVGTRARFVNWDDLVDPARQTASDLIEEDQRWYIDVAEARLEPGGVYLLTGQRLGPNDLHAFAKSMVQLPDTEDFEDADLDDDELTSEYEAKYKNIVYRAHDESTCEGNHKRSSPSAGEPGGCLLDPHRLSWRRLSGIMANSERTGSNNYRMVYQQEDVDPETVLVRKDWVNGTGGSIGCWDKDRDRLQVPPGVDLKKCISVVAVDPSPSKFWAIGWWLIDPTPESGPRRYLIDLERRGMGANKFLDYIVATQTYTGVAETMQQTSYQLGIPITHWIIESNAAQKFIYQYDTVKNWQAIHGVKIIPQDTYKNKSDPNYGVQTIGGIWELGLVRLPGKNSSMGRIAAMKLVEEVTTYPHSRTDDCVMMQWFIETHLPELLKFQRRHVEARVPARRPSWFAEEAESLKRIAGIRARPNRISARDRMMELSLERQAS